MTGKKELIYVENNDYIYDIEQYIALYELSSNKFKCPAPKDYIYQSQFNSINF